MKKMTPLRAIKLKCKEDCCSGDQKSWVDCQIDDCYLHPYRMGKNPFSKRKGNTQALINARCKKVISNTMEVSQQTDFWAGSERNKDENNKG